MFISSVQFTVRYFARSLSAVQYVTEAFFEIFGSSHDDYPAIGIQPFSGTIAHKTRRA